MTETTVELDGASQLNRKIVSQFCTLISFAFPQPGVILCDTVRGVTSPTCRLPTSLWEGLCPGVRRAPVLLTGVLLLAPGLVRAQSTPAAERAPASGAVISVPQPAAVKRPWRNEWFRDRDYFDPLIAEPRAPQIAFTFPAWIPELQYLGRAGHAPRVGSEPRPRDSDLRARQLRRRHARDSKGSQGFGLWVDVSFHMIEDMGKDPSNPIINTDYRFSLAKLKYYRVVSVSPPTTGANPVRRWKSFAVRADLYHHESTHLGDEFVINGQGAHPTTSSVRTSASSSTTSPAPSTGSAATGSCTRSVAERPGS